MPKEIQKRRTWRHSAASKEVFGHPIGFRLNEVVIGVFMVSKDVNENATIGFEPLWHETSQSFVVLINRYNKHI